MAARRSTTRPKPDKTTPAKKKDGKPRVVASHIAGRLATLDPGLARVPPPFTVSIAIADAETLVKLAKPAARALATVPGFESSLLTGLTEYRAALVDAEKSWERSRAATAGGAVQRAIHDAETLKADIMSSARYLLRHIPSAQRRLDRIAEGTGLDDLADDLRQLAKLFEEFRTAFAADTSLPRQAAEKARALADSILVGANSEAADAALARRNLTFWLVVYTSSELRAALRYVWRKDAKKLATLGMAYASQALSSLQR